MRNRQLNYKYGTTFGSKQRNIPRGLLAGGTAWLLLGWMAGGCGGGSTTTVVSAPPTPVPTATPVPTPTPGGPTPTPIPPPGTVFDLRGRTLVAGVPTAGVTVRITGSAGAVTPSDQTTSGAGGVYSFFLGAGTYTVTAQSGARTATRTVVIPAGGQTVDNFDLSL